MTADSGDVVLDLKDFLGVGHLIETQFLCYLRTHLGGVAVDGLTTSDDDIHVTNLLDGGSQCVRGGEGVGTCEKSVSEQPTCVGTTEETLSDDFAGAWRTHGEQANGAARILFLETQCLFEGVEVFRVEDCGQCGAVHGALGRHGVFTHISRVGHLLGKHHDFQCFCHKLKKSRFQNSRQRYGIFLEIITFAANFEKCLYQKS